MFTHTQSISISPSKETFKRLSRQGQNSLISWLKMQIHLIMKHLKQQMGDWRALD
jgi:hypothetical protein